MAFPVPLPHRVTVELLTPGKDASGGNIVVPSTLATGVECLITQGSGSQPVRFDQQPDVGRYTVTGTSEHLRRDDTRYKVTVGPMAGKTLAVQGVSKHGPVEGILDTPFYRASCEEVNA